MEVRKIRKHRKYRKCYECSYYKSYLKERAKKNRKAEKVKKSGGHFFKLLIGVVILHGMICVSISYALAWTEHTQVVEGVSSTIITEIVAPIVIYGATKTIENIFQKNKLAFSEPINQNLTSAGAEESEDL